jgi:hypothetical protein
MPFPRRLADACLDVVLQVSTYLQEGPDIEGHPAHEAIQKLWTATHRVNAHIFEYPDPNPLDGPREDEVSEEGRRRRKASDRLPANLTLAVGELHEAARRKRKALESSAEKRAKGDPAALEEYLGASICFIECLSDAEQATKALLEGESTDAGSDRLLARVALPDRERGGSRAPSICSTADNPNGD